jgi:hypothetical protein
MEAASTSQSATRRGTSVLPLSSLSIALALAAGLLLRLWMLRQYFLVNGDALVYGGIAKNLLLHGRYCLDGVAGEIYPTLIRLPGYPFFLALCFRVSGMENYISACWVQIVLDLAGCLLLADFARRIAPTSLSRGAAHCTLWLAALCPFTAIYVSESMTESLTLFVIALALWSAARFHAQPGWAPALWFTFAASYAALLRPDGALVGVALAPALLIGLRRNASQITISGKKLVRIVTVCALLALMPFAAWGWRNWQVFHVFQPLAPRYANDPDQGTYPGWQRWVKTWSLDFVSTFDIYWAVPGEPLQLEKLPSRAFDSPQQYTETAALANDYNVKDQAEDIVPEVDARFGKLAEERIQANPLRYHLWLPLGRLADMWLRPRVESIYDDLDWWAYARHPQKTLISYAYAGLNLLYLLLAATGLRLRPRFLWLSMAAYMVMRSGLLMTIEAPEARYTLECFPMLFVLSGIGLCEGWRRISTRLHPLTESI